MAARKKGTNTKKRYSFGIDAADGRVVLSWETPAGGGWGNLPSLAEVRRAIREHFPSIPSDKIVLYGRRESLRLSHSLPVYDPGTGYEPD